MQGMSAGLLRGATSIGLESAAQELNLDPLVGSLATAGISGSIEAMLEERNPLQGVADTYFNSATGLLTLGSPGTTSLERALYLSKVNDLSQTIREQGIGKALQTYATSILHRQTIENIWKLGGIYDLLANRDQIEFLTNSEGIQVKRIHTDTQKRDYIELTLGDDRLIGKREGNVIMHCDYVTGPDGKAVMRNGEVEILSEDGSHVLRKETVRDFKLVEIKKYSRSGNMIEVITSVDDQGILVDSSGRVIHGIRRDLVEQVVTTYLEGKTAEIKLTRPYEPTPGEKALLLNMGYTEEEISLFVQDEILSAQYGQQTLNSFIRQRDGSAIDTVSATGKHWLQLVTDRTNLRWSYLMRIIGHPPETRVELDSRRRIEQIDLDLDFPGVPVIAPNDWFIWDELIPFAANIAPNWNTAIMDATPELVGAVANKDADFIFVSGINHFRKTLDELNWMKESLATSKRIIVAHSAGTEVAIRSMLSVHADKYILISPRMAPETLRLIMQESGIQSDQVIVVQSQGDFTTWGGSYINAPNSSFLHQPWTHIYIESGPGMSLLNPLPNHAIGIEGWLGGGTYQIRINGGSSISQSIAKILAEEVKK